MMMISLRVALVALALPMQASVARRVSVQAHTAAAAENNCPYGYLCSPAPCSVENSNGQEGPTCACADGFMNGITWDGYKFGGSCSEPAPCAVTNSNSRPGPDCACDQYSEGEVTWAGAEATGSCVDQVQNLVALFTVDATLVHAEKRFKCCVSSQDPEKPIIQDMTVQKLPSARIFGSTTGCGAMFGDHWHSAVNSQEKACMVSFTDLSEATGIPRSVLVERFEEATKQEVAEAALEEEPGKQQQPLQDAEEEASGSFD